MVLTFRTISGGVGVCRPDATSGTALICIKSMILFFQKMSSSSFLTGLEQKKIKNPFILPIFV